MSSSASEIRPLTGLRFVAAFLVFLHHLYGSLNLCNLSELGLGEYGVSFFFVLSGFVLTFVYANSIGPESIRSFYWKRFARVWPLHFASLMLFVLFIPNPINQSAGRFFANLFLVQGWGPDTTWSRSYNNVAWTLSVEMFFYAVFPFLVIGGAKRFRTRFVVLSLAILSVVCFAQSASRTDALAQWSVDAKLSVILPFVRLFEFACGIGVAFIFQSRKKRLAANDGHRSIAKDTFIELIAVTGLVSFLPLRDYFNWSGLISSSTWLGPVFGTWFSSAGSVPIVCLAIYVFSTRHGLVSRILGSRMMTYLGCISYAFYLFHFPVLIWIRDGIFPGTPDSMIFNRIVSGFIISICVSIFAHHLIELPARRAILSGRFRTAFRSFGQDLQAFLASKWLAPISLVLFGAILAASDRSAPTTTPSEFQQIIQTTPEEFRNVNFKDDATLLGLETSELPNGSIQIKMVWRLNEGHRSSRFLHICDENGKILRQGDHNEKLFSVVEPNQIFVDCTVIPRNKIRDASYLGIGFYEPSRACARVSKGPRSMGDHRLNVYTFTKKFAAVETAQR